jgi:hypothetical protein
LNLSSYNWFKICGDADNFKPCLGVKNTERKLVAREHKSIANVIIASEKIACPEHWHRLNWSPVSFETGETFCTDFFL